MRLIPCKQQGHSPLFFSVYNYTTCTWTLSAIIVQVQVHAIIVQVQTSFVNFVIANSIQVTVIALTCFFFCCFFVVVFFMSRTADWSLNPLVCGAHSQMATSFAWSSRCRQNLNILPRMLANQMRAVPANYALPALYPRITSTATPRYVVIRNTNYVLLEPPDSDCLSITNSGLPNYQHLSRSNC